MANNIFGDDPLEGFLNTSMFALSRLNPSGNLLSNAWSLGTGLAGQANANMDWDFDDMNPETSLERENGSFFNNDDMFSSDTDNFGLGEEQSANPFSGLEGIAGLGFGALKSMF